MEHLKNVLKLAIPAVALSAGAVGCAASSAERPSVAPAAQAQDISQSTDGSWTSISGAEPGLEEKAVCGTEETCDLLETEKKVRSALAPLGFGLRQQQSATDQENALYLIRQHNGKYDPSNSFDLLRWEGTRKGLDGAPVKIKADLSKISGIEGLIRNRNLVEQHYKTTSWADIINALGNARGSKLSLMEMSKLLQHNLHYENEAIANPDLFVVEYVLPADSLNAEWPTQFATATNQEIPGRVVDVYYMCKPTGCFGEGNKKMSHMGSAVYNYKTRSGEQFILRHMNISPDRNAHMILDPADRKHYPYVASLVMPRDLYAPGENGSSVVQSDVGKDWGNWTLGLRASGLGMIGDNFIPNKGFPLFELVGTRKVSDRVYLQLSMGYGYGGSERVKDPASRITQPNPADPFGMISEVEAYDSKNAHVLLPGVGMGVVLSDNWYLDFGFGVPIWLLNNSRDVKEVLKYQNGEVFEENSYGNSNLENKVMGSANVGIGYRVNDNFSIGANAQCMTDFQGAGACGGGLDFKFHWEFK